MPSGTAEVFRGGQLCSAPSLLQPEDVVDADGLEEAFQLEVADQLGLDQRLDSGVDRLGDQHLAVAGLGADAGRTVCDRADRGIVVATLEPNPADVRVALVDAEPETKPDIAPAPPSLG